MSDPLIIIGIGHNGPAGLSPESRAHIASAQLLAGGKRNLAFFPDFAGETIVIAADVPAFIEKLKATRGEKKTVVIASGDPLFYGVGSALIAAFPKDDLVFEPHVSSVQLAFARLKESWHDARFVTTHGRPIASILPALEERAAKIAVLTDAKNDPAAIGLFLQKRGAQDEYAIWVCEDLGGASERISQWTAETIAGKTFSPLNVVVLLRKASAEKTTRLRTDSPLVGIPDQELAHGGERRGMITKREVRLLSLAYLHLQPHDTLWDVGAGSGSISVEAARLSPTLQVFAIERSEAALQHIQENIAKFNLSRIKIVFGSAPGVFSTLPTPDAVFIGGTGGRLGEIVVQAVERLQPGGRLVMNCITIETFSRGWSLMDQLGLEPQATNVQLSHSKPLANLHAMEPDSPIFILRGRKP